MECADLRVAWQRALPAVGSSQRPFAEAVGPAGAMMASALRIGWRIPSPFAVIDVHDSVLDMRCVCPMVIRQHAERDLSAFEARGSTMAARIGGAPDLEPLADFVFTKQFRRSAVAVSLRSLGEGGWWTQARLFAEGVAGIADPFCRACSSPSCEPRFEGTLHHRCCTCPATRSLRDDFKDQAILAKAQS